MTGSEYAGLIASYLSKRFGSRGLKVDREVRVGKSIIGKNRCIDVFCVPESDKKAFAIECIYQDSAGTVDGKIPYALDDLEALPMEGCIAYAGKGFSEGVLHMLNASPVSRAVLEHPYYNKGLRFQIAARSSEGIETPLIDGGAFDWVAKLTSNRRAVYVASGLGSQLVPLIFRRPRVDPE